MRHPNREWHIQHLAEDHALRMLENIGYRVYLNSHNGHTDLIINGRLRITVKGALYTPHRCSPGRWQFNTRNHPDLYILHCLPISGADFVIPGREIGTRTNIAIWSKNPYNYHGQWAKYLNAWHVIEAELERKRNDENPD